VETERDCWAEWLAERRYGGDSDVRRRFSETLERRADEVLDLAQLCEAERLLDVGCGEGLIGFRALERGAGTVTFSDISRDLLDFCREAATDLGVRRRRFVQCQLTAEPGYTGSPRRGSSVGRAHG
jgi:cyclopropane fatty-acyl-phospholipid synthase-like methyltransferase